MAVTLAASMTACGAPQAVDDDKDSKDTAQTEEKKEQDIAIGRASCYILFFSFYRIKVSISISYTSKFDRFQLRQTASA